MLKALVLDVDGTLADTESVHRAAFNQAFAALGLDWHWDQPLYTSLLDISGGKERMLHYCARQLPGLQTLGGMALPAAIERLHALKTQAYEAAVQGGALQLRPGVLALLQEARAQGLLLAIATTTSPANIAALLGYALGPHWRSFFSAIGDAATAPRKKPDPQVYRQVLAVMGLEPAQCLAFEDSANGLQASRAAGLATIITPTPFTAHHDFAGALRVLPDLGAVDLACLRRWHTGTLH